MWYEEFIFIVLIIDVRMQQPIPTGTPIYFGDEAFAKRGILYLRYPVMRGFVNNWDNLVFAGKLKIQK